MLRRLAWLGCALALLCSHSRIGAAAENAVWEHSPYQVQVVLAVDDSASPRPGLEASLAKSIADRIEVTLRPLWKSEIKMAEAGAERRQCLAPQEIPWEDFAAEQASQDKLLWLGVKVVPGGYKLTCREFDIYLRRWGPPRTAMVQQASYLAEASFGLLTETFSPLALITPIEGDDERIQLSFKGSRLPNPSGEEHAGAAGDAFLPLLRRSDRSGKLMEKGIQAVPWTYLTLAETNDAGWLGAVHSGMRRPFGVAKRGQIEQVAIGIGATTGDTRLRFHARTDAKEGLAGYEVFRELPDGETARIGVTDRDGMIDVPPSGERVSMLLLRSDGQVLAKVPVVNGTAGVQQTPIADNVTRLQAQAEAQVVREELIDLVARRAIMMGRVKSMLKKGRIDDAKELMAQLDEMPSPSVFGRSIDNAARRIQRSDDPTVQKRIDSLFSSTRDMLGKFLSTRDVTNLKNEVYNAAEAPPAADEQPPAEEPAPTS